MAYAPNQARSYDEQAGPASIPVATGLTNELGDGAGFGSTKMSTGWQSRAFESLSPNTAALRAETSMNDVHMTDVCAARLTSLTDTFDSKDVPDHPIAASMNPEPQKKDEHHRDHKDAGDGGSIIPSKRTWDPNDDIGPPAKRRNTAKSRVETQRPVYSSVTGLPTNIFSSDEDIETEDASYVPELMSPSNKGSIEDSSEVNEDGPMVSQDQTEQEASSKVLKDDSHVNIGVTPEKRDFRPSRMMQRASSEQATLPEQGLSSQMIGPRDNMRAGVEREDGKAQDSVLLNPLAGLAGPRKHPKPTANSMAKVVRGRSKTGCITCRKRKKICDETKPGCK
jgi:hypothetical protein